ncbi:MAG: SpoIIIAH-like family protein [Bacillota bacterium]
MKDRARSGFALMVVIAVVLGILIGTRNMGPGPNDTAQPAAAGTNATREGKATPETRPTATTPATTTTTETGDATGDFFAEYRLERSRARSRNVETLRQILADEEASEEARAAASMQLVDLSKKTEAEAEAEALIRARGYKDALVFVRGDACDVVVSGPELTRADAEQIGDIAARCLGVELAKITIVERGR